jgi:shikimate dehydrogenase
MHAAEGSAQGLDYVYRPIDLTALGIGPELLPEILVWAERLGFDALNITHPCKQLALEHLDRVDPGAEALGAVNTVLFTAEGRVGYNTDTTGFEAAFRAGMPAARTDRVVQLGAGGAGSAVADALLRLGTRRLSIVDLDTERAIRLAADLTSRHGAEIEGVGPEALPERLAEADGVVHCTPRGMREHPGAPFDLSLLRPELWVADIVYRPIETELLRGARALGCATLDGGGMAVFQAVDAFRLITGREADPERMMRHFHQMLDDEHRTHE